MFLFVCLGGVVGWATWLTLKYHTTPRHDTRGAAAAAH